MDSSDDFPSLQHSINGLPAHHRLVADAKHAAVRRPRGRDVRTAWLTAIKADIADNMGKPTFKIGEVVARHGISARHIRRLFEGSGDTFTSYVREQRLLAAHRMLTDSRFDRHAISAIAFGAGFGDLSYFNRVFRARFSTTPTEVRAAARGTE